MPPGSKPAWTTTRKLMGNLVPLAVSLPFLILGLRAFPQEGMSGSALIYFIAFPVSAWLAVNLSGFIWNVGLSHEVGRMIHLERPFIQERRVFVGFARPAFTGLLDPHEDVGYLIIRPEELEFFGETVRIKFPREAVETIRFRANPHTWVGLGGWISVEGSVHGQHVRMLVEPRERPTLVGNLALLRKVLRELKAWRAGVPLGTEVP